MADAHGVLGIDHQGDGLEAARLATQRGAQLVIRGDDRNIQQQGNGHRPPSARQGREKIDVISGAEHPRNR